MGFMTKKREIDIVSVFAVAVAAVILTFFSAWLHYSNKVDKIKSSYEMKVQIIKENMFQIQDKNKKLEDKLAKIKEFVKTNDELVKALEE